MMKSTVPNPTNPCTVIHVWYSWYIYLHLLDFYGSSCRVNIPFVPWILLESTCSTTLLEPRKRVSVTIRRPSVTGFPSVSVTSCFFLKLVFIGDVCFAGRNLFLSFDPLMLRMTINLIKGNPTYKLYTYNQLDEKHHRM